MIYFDTSALIKAFVEERGSAAVKNAIGREEFIGIAKITYVEIHSGLNRKRRAKELTEKDFAIAVQEFEARYTSWVRMQIDDRVLFLVRDLTSRYPLRALDAIQLAAAFSLKSEIDEDVVFAAADQRLLDASETEGLRTWHVEKEPEAPQRPEMIPVNSRSIHSVGYDTRQNRLHIRFRGTDETYFYEGVPKSLFTALLQSKSKAAYLNRFVKDRYRIVATD